MGQLSKKSKPYFFKMTFNFKHTLIWVVLFGVSGSFKAFAGDDEPKKNNFSIDATGRFASKQFGGGLSAWGHHGFGKSRKFSIGLGLRLSTNIGSDMEYTTAPAKFTSDEKNVDTLLLKNSSVNSFNLALDFRYRIIDKLSVGFNIDAIGFSFGGEENGGIISEGDVFLPKAKPTSLNALLVGDNDIGTLNSELYVLYHVGSNFSIKAGVSYLFTEYTTDKKYIDGIDNDRYRNKSMGGLIGIQYRFP